MAEERGRMKCGIMRGWVERVRRKWVGLASSLHLDLLLESHVPIQRAEEDRTGLQPKWFRRTFTPLVNPASYANLRMRKVF